MARLVRSNSDTVLHGIEYFEAVGSLGLDNRPRLYPPSENRSQVTLISHLSEHSDNLQFAQYVEVVVERPCSRQPTFAMYTVRLEVFHLPTYSPKLNLVALIWKRLRV